MSTPTTLEGARATSTLASDFDDKHRAQARAAGRPLERTAAPGIFGQMRKDADVDVAMVWTDASGSLAYFCARESRTPVRLTIHALDFALGLPPKDLEDQAAHYAGLVTPRRLIVSDHQTLRRLIAWVKVAASTAPDGDFEAISVHRRLILASHLVASTRLVVLTRALARKFWLGSQYDPEDFGAWRRAFGFGAGATLVSVMTGLVDQASEGHVHSPWAVEAFGAESYALMSASFSGMKSAVAAFRRVQTADTATRAILTTDPLLRERAILDGSVCTMRILNKTDKSFTAVVSTPFKFRPGKKILLIDPTSDAPGAWAETTLQAVTVSQMDGQDQLIAQVACSQKSGTSLSKVIDAVMALPGRTAMASESPYLPFSGADSRAVRWTQHASERIDADAAEARPRRDIPLDIIVAGAPTA
jgi:hypothetical protein